MDGHNHSTGMFAVRDVRQRSQWIAIRNVTVGVASPPALSHVDCLRHLESWRDEQTVITEIR
jgi:hypothetical protein